MFCVVESGLNYFTLFQKDFCSLILSRSIFTAFLHAEAADYIDWPLDLLPQQAEVFFIIRLPPEFLPVSGPSER